MQAVHFGDGGSCDIRVQDTHPVAPFCHHVRQGRRHHRLSHTALAADHADHMLDLRVLVRLHQKARRLLLGRASLAALFCAAGIAAFSLCHYLFLLEIYIIACFYYLHTRPL